MMSMKAALLALELLDRHPECANRLLHGQHRATAAGAAASPVRVAVIWLRPRQVKLLALWRRPAEICASTAGLCSAPSGDGDARAMGRETAVSSSPPRISFQKENELYSSRLLFPFTQPPRVSNALSTPCSRPGTARNSLCLRVQLGLSVCLWLCSRETPAALLHGTGGSVPASERRRGSLSSGGARVMLIGVGILAPNPAAPGISAACACMTLPSSSAGGAGALLSSAKL